MADSEKQDRDRGRPQPPRRGPETDARTGSPSAAARIAQQHTWVDLQVRQAIERGDFDDLPGRGKPIEGLGERHDPDWWVKRLVERERIAVLPASLQLRKDDAELDGLLDRLVREQEVREAVEEFNARVIRARYTPADGPPLITMPRDVEETVAAWAQRRAARRDRMRHPGATTAGDRTTGDRGTPTTEAVARRRPRWWRRRRT